MTSTPSYRKEVQTDPSSTASHTLMQILNTLMTLRNSRRWSPEIVASMFGYSRVFPRRSDGCEVRRRRDRIQLVLLQIASLHLAAIDCRALVWIDRVMSPWSSTRP